MNSKSVIEKTIVENRARMIEAEKHIFANPETGYREYNTSAYLARQFEELGYTLTLAGNIPGFTAELDTGRPGPCLGILAELDSLIVPDHPAAHPETGAVHSCGHHAQCAAMLGIAASLKAPGALDEMSGKIRLVVVPAEELIEIDYRESLLKSGVLKYFGGKVEFLYRGLLDGIDLCFMVHTSSTIAGGFSIGPGNNGCITKNLTFKGTSAHAGGAPDKGINALYAANLGLTATNALRETFRDDDHIRFHPIMTEGGGAVNAIPNRAKIESYVRASSVDAVVRENKKLNRAMAASAAAIGAELKITDRFGYMPLNNDKNMIDLAVEIMNDIAGSDKVKIEDRWSTGSTDMGDLSSLMPVLHPMVGGACGTGHGNDYYINDPETACVKSALFQSLFALALLKDDAKAAKDVIRGKTVVYPDKAAYFEAVDAIAVEKDAVIYNEDGTVTLNYC